MQAFQESIRGAQSLASVCGVFLLTSLLPGCRTSAPIYVWHPPQVAMQPAAKIALAPVAGDPVISQRIEQAILSQRPSASADIAVFTADQLAESSPIRLASTAPLTNDAMAIQAARAVGADVVLLGEILSTDITAGSLNEAESNKAESQTQNMNELFFQRLNQSENADEHHILLSWRIIDVETSQTVGSQAFTLHSRQAKLQYPDLAATESEPAVFLIEASARETWKSLAPVVSKEQVRLSVPWLQPGAFLVRRGVRAAKKGQWQQAESYWQEAADRFWFNAPAHHNLAVAKAAREDFESAKAELADAHALLNFRLPSETLFWLDQKHRLYHQAHGLGRPHGGWAFPDPIASTGFEANTPPIDVDDLPWWTAIPLVKPPQWTWRGWLAQAWPL